MLAQKLIKDYEASKFWYQHFGQHTEFAVVKPVLAIPEKLITASEEARGENLYQLILENARFYPSADKMAVLNKQMHKVGEWLQYKQSILAIEGETYSIEELVDYMDVRFKILLEDSRRRFPADYRRKILNFIEYNRPALTAAELTVTTNHSDFNPGNILIDNDTVTVLDFGRLVSGSYLLDVCKLHFQLQLLTFKPQYRPSVIGELQKSLLAGFGNPDADDLRMFRFLSVRNILTHLTSVTHFWRNGFAERQYNLWVLRQELKLLDSILRDKKNVQVKGV